MGVAVIAAIVSFLTACAFVASVVHESAAPSVWWSGIIAASWCIWPALKGHQVERYNMLQPVPRLYKIPWKNAFAKVRDILARGTYKLGSKWHVSTADTQAKHIHATLQFVDEEKKWDAPGGRVENIRQSTERVRRLVELDVTFKEQDEFTIIQLDFQTEAEGTNAIYACDFVIEDIKSAIEREMGQGTNVGNPAEFKLGAPPWWLLGLTGFGLVVLWQDVMKSVFK